MLENLLNVKLFDIEILGFLGPIRLYYWVYDFLPHDILPHDTLSLHPDCNTNPNPNTYPNRSPKTYPNPNPNPNLDVEAKCHEI